MEQGMIVLEKNKGILFDSTLKQGIAIINIYEKIIYIMHDIGSYIVHNRSKEGESRMIKTLYLNFDLEKEDEQEAYDFLESLGRAKKKFVMAMLVKHGLVEASEPKAKKKTLETRKGKESQKAEPVQESQFQWQTPVQKIMQPEVQQPYLQQLVHSSGAGTDWQSYFTPGQVQDIQEAGHDMSIAKPNMLRSMREHMENGVPVASAYSIAAFDNHE